MNHLHENQLIDYLSGEIHNEEAQAVGKHLESCLICREKLQDLSASISDFISAYPGEPDKAFWSNYLPRLRERMDTAPKPNLGYFQQIASALAGGVVVLFMVLLIKGWFPTNDVSLHFEEWMADNLYGPVITSEDLESVDKLISESIDYTVLEYLSFDEDDLNGILDELSSDQLDEALSIIENQSVLYNSDI